MWQGSPTLPPGAPRAAHRLQGFYGQGQQHRLGQAIKGPPPLKPTQAAPGDSREGPSHMIRVQQCSAGPGTQPRAGGRQLRRGADLGRAVPGLSRSGGSASETHMPAHSSMWVGTLAKVLEKSGNRHQRSVLFGRQTLSLCPESRNFSKPAITAPPSGRQPADPTLPGRRPGLEPSRAPRPVPSCLDASGVPQGHPAAFRVTPVTGDVSLATLPLQITRLGKKAVGLDMLLSRISA